MDIERLQELYDHLTQKGNKYMRGYTIRVEHNTRARMIILFRKCGASEKVIEKVKDELKKNKDLSGSKEKPRDLNIRSKQKKAS